MCLVYLKTSVLKQNVGFSKEGLITAFCLVTKVRWAVEAYHGRIKCGASLTS